MNDVPLVKANNIHDINTSIIAIKKQLKQLNEAVGLIDMPTIDTSIFVKKSEVVDVVEEGNMNPVTSNAVVPVDEVTSGNMQSVTSNAVAKCLSYSETPIKVGKWDGVSDVYKLACRFPIPQNGTSGMIPNYQNLLAGKAIITVSGSYTANGIYFPINGCWDASFTWGLSVFVDNNGGINYNVGTASRIYEGYAFVNIYYV